MESKILLTNKKTIRLTILSFLFILMTLLGFNVQAQNFGDFQSKATGSWTAPTTWQIYDGSGWVDATTEIPEQSESLYNVTILTGHIVTVDQGASGACYDLTIDLGARLIIEPDGLLTVINILTNNAGVDGILIRASDILPSGSLVFHNTTTPVPATVEFYSKASTTQDPTQYHYQFFGIPFAEMQPLGNLDGSFIFRHNETNPAMWEPITNDSLMLPMLGYAITQDAPTTYTMQGDLYNLPFFMPLSYSIMNTEIGDYKIGEHIIANPYTAAIPIESIDFGNNNEFSPFITEETVYLYNTGSYMQWVEMHNNDGDAAGQYRSVPKEFAGQEGLPSSIPSMQGFMVKVFPNNPAAIKAENRIEQLEKTKNAPVGNFLSIPYPSDKNTEPLRAKKAETEKTITIIDINGQRFGDKVWLFTEPTCTKAFDNGYDGRKIKGSALTPQLYAIEADGNYQVNAVNDINNTLLGFTPGVDTEYTMKFTHNNSALVYPQGIYLLDLVKDKAVDITTSGSTYTFTTEASSNVNGMKAPSATTEAPRFKIVTAPEVVTGNSNIPSSINVFATGSKLIVDNKTSLQGELMLFDASGRNLLSKTVESGLSTIQVNVPSGVYIARLTTKDLTVKSTIIIQ